MEPFAKIASHQRALNVLLSPKSTESLNLCKIQRQPLEVFLKISQNSQENTCARASFLIKLQATLPAVLLKKRLWHRYFPMKIEKFLRTPSSTEHLRWLLLKVKTRFRVTTQKVAFPLQKSLMENFVSIRKRHLS